MCPVDVDKEDFGRKCAVPRERGRERAQGVPIVEQPSVARRRNGFGAVSIASTLAEFSFALPFFCLASDHLIASQMHRNLGAGCVKLASECSFQTVRYLVQI